MSATVQSRRIELREYACFPGVVLSRPERDALQRAAPDISIRPVVGTEDCYDLTPGSMIGVTDTGSVVISIQPKIAIERVMFLISYAVDPSCWKELSSEYAGHDSLVEAIAPAFCRLVSRATYRGLLHGYRATEDAMCTVKGRIRFDDQIRDRFGIAPPVEVSYDEFTEDITENQLLRAAIHRLRRLRLRSSLTVRALHEIEDAFYGVQLVRYDHRRLPEIPITRLNRHYESALALARLILRASSFEHAIGAVTASCFLVDMNDVFESFVRRALQEALKADALSFGKINRGLRLDADRRIKLEPDLSWWRGGRCVFVGDCKYKRLSAAGFLHADLYQLLAYTIASHVPSGMLIYAAGECEPTKHLVDGVDKRLLVRTLDLEGSESQILGQVEGIAREILRTSECL